MNDEYVNWDDYPTHGLTCREVAEIQLNIYDQLLFNHIEYQLDGDHCAHVIEYYANQSERLDVELAAAIVQTQPQQFAQDAT